MCALPRLLLAAFVLNAVAGAALGAEVIIAKDTPAHAQPRFFERVQLENGVVKAGDAVVCAFFRRLPRFNRAREVGVFEMNDAAGACCPLADERNGSVDGHAIKPGIGELFFLQGRQAAPDLEQDFLIQIVLVSRIP